MEALVLLTIYNLSFQTLPAVWFLFTPQALSLLFFVCMYIYEHIQLSSWTQTPLYRETSFFYIHQVKHMRQLSVIPSTDVWILCINLAYQNIYIIYTHTFIFNTITFLKQLKKHLHYEYNFCQCTYSHMYTVYIMSVSQTTIIQCYISLTLNKYCSHSTFTVH